MINSWDALEVVLNAILKNTKYSYRINKKERIVQILDITLPVATMYLDKKQLDKTDNFNVDYMTLYSLHDCLKNTEIKEDEHLNKIEHKLVGIIKDNQSEQQVKHVRNKVDEIMNSKSLEKVINLDMLYRPLTEDLKQRLLDDVDEPIVLPIPLVIGDTLTLIVKRTKDTYVDENDVGCTVVDENVINCLNELLTIDNLGTYFLPDDTKIDINSNSSSVSIKLPCGILYVFTRKNQDKYSLLLSGYAKSFALNRYYNNKGIFFSGKYTVDCFADFSELFIVGLNKEKVDRGWSSISKNYPKRTVRTNFKYK